MDSGEESITDSEARAQVRQQARRIHVQSMLAAATVTAMTFLAPE